MYTSNTKNIISKLREASRRGILGAAGVYASAIRGSISGPSPSSPGSPPGMRSGRLRQSVAISSLTIAKDPEALVGLDTSVGGVGKTPPHLYGLFLEGGAAAGRRRPFRLPDGSWRIRKNPMAPRPFFKPMLSNSAVGQAATSKFESIVKEAIK